MSTPELYDVIGVNIETGAERFIAHRKTLPNAQAIVNLAVMRRGVDEEFFKEVPCPYQIKGTT